MGPEPGPGAATTSCAVPCESHLVQWQMGRLVTGGTWGGGRKWRWRKDDGWTIGGSSEPFDQRRWAGEPWGGKWVGGWLGWLVLENGAFFHCALKNGKWDSQGTREEGGRDGIVGFDGWVFYGDFNKGGF